MGFRAYATRRIVNTLIVLVVTLVLQFFIFRVMPGNPITHFVNPNLPLEARQALLQMWGLDRPLHEQFITYLYNLFSGRLGISFVSQRYVSDEIIERLPNTILLMGSSTILSIGLGISLGVSAGSHRGTKRDVATVTIGLLTEGLPVFFLGLLLLLTFAYYLPIATGGLINFPVAGTISRPPRRPARLHRRHALASYPTHDHPRGDKLRRICPDSQEPDDRCPHARLHPDGKSKGPGAKIDRLSPRSEKRSASDLYDDWAELGRNSRRSRDH